MGRDITAVIGERTYYEQVGTNRSFKNGSNNVDVYLVKITGLSHSKIFQESIQT